MAQRRSQHIEVNLTDMWRGENEQPPWKRMPGAVESSSNIRFNTLRGASKRGPTDLVADISTDLSLGGLDPTKDYHWTSIGEFAIAIGHGIVRGFDADGVALPIDVDVTTEGGVAYTIDGASANSYNYRFTYLNETSPRTAFDTTVAVDTILVANRNTVVAAGYTRTFQESIDKIIADIVADDDPSAPAATAVFRGSVDSYDDLVEQIEPVAFKTTQRVDVSPSPPYEWSKGDPLEVLKVSGDSYSPKHLATFDSFEQSDGHNKWIIVLLDWRDANGDEYQIRHGEIIKHDTASPVEQFTLADPHEAGKRAKRASDGNVWRTKLDFGSNPAGYYCFYKGNDLEGQLYRIPASQVGDQQTSGDTGATGHDERAAEDGRITASTCYHRILIDEDTSSPRLAIGLVPFEERRAGNKDTNKVPSFVGEKIKALQFVGSRLAVVAGSSIGISRTNDFFNHYVDNPLNLIDTDRVDKDINSRNIGEAMRAEVLGDSLMIRCKNGTLLFHSGDQALTSTNGRFRQLGDFKDKDIPSNGNGVLVNIVDESNRVHQFRSIGGKDNEVVYAGQLNDHRPKVFDGLSVVGIYVVEKSTFFMTE